VGPRQDDQLRLVERLEVPGRDDEPSLERLGQPLGEEGLREFARRSPDHPAELVRLRPVALPDLPELELVAHAASRGRPCG